MRGRGEVGREGGKREVGTKEGVTKIILRFIQGLRVFTLVKSGFTFNSDMDFFKSGFTLKLNPDLKSN